MKNIRIHAVIKGNVQGVGFRVSTRRVAKQLKVVGTVRNLPDGSVAIVAEGSQQQLEQLIDILQKKHFLKEIQEINVNSCQAESQFTDFCILD